MRGFVVSSKMKSKYFYSLLFKTFLGHFIPLLVFFAIFNSVEFKVEILFAVFCGWFLFFATPTTVLFLNHLRNSLDKKIMIEGNKIRYFSSNQEEQLSLNEISQIVLNLSPPSYDKRADFLFFGKYFYTSFILKNGKTFSVSCLLLDDVESKFPQRIIERKKKGFPLIPH